MGEERAGTFWGGGVGGRGVAKEQRRDGQGGREKLRFEGRAKGAGGGGATEVPSERRSDQRGSR